MRQRFDESSLLPNETSLIAVKTIVARYNALNKRVEPMRSERADN